MQITIDAPPCRASEVPVRSGTRGALAKDHDDYVALPRSRSRERELEGGPAGPSPSPWRRERVGIAVLCYWGTRVLCQGMRRRSWRASWLSSRRGRAHCAGENGDRVVVDLEVAREELDRRRKLWRPAEPRWGALADDVNGVDEVGEDGRQSGRASYGVFNPNYHSEPGASRRWPGTSGWSGPSCPVE